MQIIIPLAGQGRRFQAAGYSTIKPLLRVDGKTILQRVVEMYPGEREVVFIVNRSHLETQPLREHLKELVPTCQILVADPHELGPVWSVLHATEAIDPLRPVVVNYCDAVSKWHWPTVRNFLNRTQADCVLAGFKGYHPHAQGERYFAYLRETGGRVYEVREKAAFTDNRDQEYASTGMFWFRSGGHLCGLLDASIDKGHSINGEFYLTAAANLLCRAGRMVSVLPVESFVHLGTPEEFKSFEFYERHFR